MKYRKKPEDFIVEEIANHKILKNGRYKLYTLEKEGVETFGLLDKISKINNIPRKQIGIAGIKDTYAKTKQFMTIPKEFKIEKIENVKVQYIGYVNEPLKLGNLLENKFIITVRGIEKYELDGINQNAKLVNSGIPNYFDSQRFGSVMKKEFIGRLLVQKRYEVAVKLYLTSIVMSDNETRRHDKEQILDSWPSFDIEIQSEDLKKIVDKYKETKKWIVAYKFISPQLREFYISSYQSYIWNECIKLLLKENLGKHELYFVPYEVDELYFNNTKELTLPKTFQTVSHKVVLKDYEKKILDKVLEKEGTAVEKFNIRQTGNFFKSHERDILFFIKNFKMEEPVQDGPTFNVTVSFTLKKSCYATIVLKKIFGQ